MAENTAGECAVTTRVEAPADVVYDMVSDLARMGEWSPECKRVEWLGGATGAKAGARFKGHNQRGIRRWSTKGQIVTAERPKELSFDVASVFNLPVARWIYRIEPDGDNACLVTEVWQDHRGRFMNVLGAVASGVAKRKEHNTGGMEETLRKVKAAAEQQGAAA
jgi:uncharacterized protein YndB with AHSA1/START domain